MKYVNRFLFFCYIASGIAAVGFAVCSFAGAAILFLFPSLMSGLLYFVLNHYYDKFNFAECERIFSFLPDFDPETQACYDALEIIIHLIKHDWPRLDMTPRLEVRKVLRIMYEAEKDLHESQKVFKFFSGELEEFYY